MEAHMDSYAQVPSDIQTAFQGINSCLEKLADLFDDFTFDAGEDGWDIDESDCKHLCLDIKSACCKLEMIRLNLSEIAKFHNKSFISEHPLFFQSYIDTYQMTMQEETLYTLNEALKLKSELPLIAKLKEMKQLMDSTLKLCHKVIATEERIKRNPKKCLGMLEEVIRMTTENQQGVIDLYIHSGLTPKTDLFLNGKPMISDIMKQYATPEEFATACFHQFSQSDINIYVVHKALLDNILQGFTEEELKWWNNDREMIENVRYLIEHFDEMGVEGKQITKEGKRIIAPKYIYMLMKWSHLLDASSSAKVPQFIKYIEGIYKGKLHIPAGSTFHKYKNSYDKEEWQNFTDKIKTILQSRKQKAIQISL